MRYGSIGEGPHGPEVFLPGSFGNVEQADILLNVQHDRSRVLARAPGTMRLIDSNSVLTLTAKPPDTAEARDAKLMVRAGVLQGLSIEFNAKEQEQRNGVRVISRAELVGVGLVDRPAYPESTVEARALMGRTLRAYMPTGKKLSCECSGKDCHFAAFATGSVQKALDSAFKRYASEGDDLVASLHSYDKPIASVSRGSIRRAGKESIDIDLPADEVGRELLAARMPVNLLADSLAVEMDITLATAQRLLAVATELVTRFAPTAPDIILDESVRRVSGWLWGSTNASVKSESAGPFRLVYAVSEKSALRHSGAMNLLSPYKTHRAAVIA